MGRFCSSDAWLFQFHSVQNKTGVMIEILCEDKIPTNRRQNGLGTHKLLLPAVRIVEMDYLCGVCKMDIKMIKGVIFDMDGVLVDNRDAHIEAFEQLFAKYGVPFDREKFMCCFGMTNDMIFARQAPELLEKHSVAELSLEKEQLYRANFEKSIAPTRGLVDFLKSLKAHGIRISVGSSGNTRNVNFVLSRCHIAEYFDAIADGDMISHGKPDPEVYLLAAKLLGLDPSECVVVEDAPVGIEAARRAGMAVVALATTFTRDRIPDYDILVDDFTQLTYEQIMQLPKKRA